MARVKNKLITSLLAVTLAFSLTACAKQADIDNAVTPLSSQITTINTTLTEMQTLDTTLDGYIEALQTAVGALETDNTANKTEIETLKTTIATLQAKDTAVETAIEDLQNLLTSEITDMETWVNDTFVTIAQCTALQTEIDGLKSSVTEQFTAIQEKIDEIESRVERLESKICILENGSHTFDTGKCACGEKVEITSIAIIIDGVEYDNQNTSVESPALIYADSTVTLKAYGYYLNYATTNNYVNYGNFYGVAISHYWWTVAEDGMSANCNNAMMSFTYCTEAFEIKYSNEGSNSDYFIGSGVWIKYDTSKDATIA